MGQLIKQFSKLDWKKVLISIIGLLILTTIFYFPKIWKLTKDIPEIGFILGFFMIFTLIGGLGLIGSPVGYICYKGYRKLRTFWIERKTKEEKAKCIAVEYLIGSKWIDQVLFEFSIPLLIGGIIVFVLFKIPMDLIMPWICYVGLIYLFLFWGGTLDKLFGMSSEAKIRPEIEKGMEELSSKELITYGIILTLGSIGSGVVVWFLLRSTVEAGFLGILTLFGINLIILGITKRKKF